MTERLATDFSEIESVLRENISLKELILKLVEAEPISGKSTEEKERLSAFREVLISLVNGNISLHEAYSATMSKLPQQTSQYSNNKRVFPDGWAERLVRTQFSRFYNQAVMEILINEGETYCYVPHSSLESADSPCSLNLAGRKHDVKLLHSLLVDSYSNGNWSKELKIPNHPHCTHVVTRVP